MRHRAVRHFLPRCGHRVPRQFSWRLTAPGQLRPSPDSAGGTCQTVAPALTADVATLVEDRHPQLAAYDFGRNRDGRTWRRIARAVIEQVRQHLADLHEVERRRR